MYPKQLQPHQEGQQTCTVSAIVRFIPLSELQSIASTGSLTLPRAPPHALPASFSFHAKGDALASPGYGTSPGYGASSSTTPRSAGQLSLRSDATSTSATPDPFVRCVATNPDGAPPFAPKHAPPGGKLEAPHIVPLTATSATAVTVARADSLVAASCRAHGGSRATSDEGTVLGSAAPSPRRRTPSVERLLVPTVSSLGKQVGPNASPCKAQQQRTPSNTAPSPRAGLRAVNTPRKAADPTPPTPRRYAVGRKGTVCAWIIIHRGGPPSNPTTSSKPPTPSSPAPVAHPIALPASASASAGGVSLSCPGTPVRSTPLT